MDQIAVYTDGGSRGNPGPAASAFIIEDSQGKKIHEEGFYLGETTNNVAEYTAVLKAVEWLKKCSVFGVQCSVNFYLDSLLVVNQMAGKFKIKDPRLKDIYNKISFQISNLKSQIKWNHIPREKNMLADALVNSVLNRKKE